MLNWQAFGSTARSFAKPDPIPVVGRAHLRNYYPSFTIRQTIVIESEHSCERFLLYFDLDHSTSQKILAA